MTAASIRPPGPPLPPNRRVLGRGARAGAVQAPDEQAAPDLAAPDPGEFADGSPERTPRAGLPNGQPDQPSSFAEALRVALGVLATIAAALGCVLGLVRYTRTSPRFSVRTIEVQGGSHRSTEDIAREGGIAKGENIFGLDLEATKVGILTDPWIERVSVHRTLPSTIAVEVVEREAAALVAVGSDLYLSTRQGELFKRPEPGDPYDLPVVTGTRPDDIATDPKAAALMIKKALDLVSDYERVGPARRLPVQEVHIEDDGSLVLSVGKEVVALRVGKGPYRQTLEQASRVLGELAARRAEASVLFLDNEAHPERVVVRMR